MLLYDDVIREGNPLLREKSKDVNLPLSDEDKAVIFSMNEYLKNSYDNDLVKEYNLRPGVGLACVQIGILKKILCIYAYDEYGQLHEYNVINPKIIKHSAELTFLDGGEGCLSINEDYQGYIQRYKRVTVDCYLYDVETESTRHETLTLNGYLSVVFQHEYDHLNGILFTDHIDKEDPFKVAENSTPVKFGQER